jgi:hypothetical protein
LDGLFFEGDFVIGAYHTSAEVKRQRLITIFSVQQHEEYHL